MALSPADAARVVGVRPDLIVRVARVLTALDALGFPMRVTSGVRTQAAQVALYAQGRTTPGPIVTYADGVTTLSRHQAQVDGLGHAIDCCFLVDGQPSWDARLPWNVYGAALEALGVTWGGSWTRLHDLPHAEWRA